MLEGITVFFQNLPKLMALASKIFALLSDRNALDWINNLEASVDSLKQAKDEYDKGKAAQSIAGDIRDLQ